MLLAAAAIGLCAQVVVRLPGTPVPFTLQTFAVLVLAAALGSFEGTAAVGVYLLGGAAGLPWFAGGSAGLSAPSAGYLLGMFMAAPVMGLAPLLALPASGGEPGRRGVAVTVGLTVVSTAIIYLAGTVWLADALHLGAATAVRLGVVPFLPGDTVKAVAAGLLLPAAWRLLRR